MLITKPSSKGLWEHNEVIHGMKPRLLQEASHSLESGTRKFSYDEARATVAGLPQPQVYFTLLGLLLLQEPRRGALI